MTACQSKPYVILKSGVHFRTLLLNDNLILVLKSKVIF